MLQYKKRSGKPGCVWDLLYELQIFPPLILPFGKFVTFDLPLNQAALLFVTSLAGENYAKHDSESSCNSTHISELHTPAPDTPANQD